MEGTSSRKRVKTDLADEFVTDEMFEELNQQGDYLEKIATDNLEIGKPYKVVSFRMINTQYGRSLTCALVVNGENRRYFFGEHF